MIEVHLIGTGGTVPLPKRWLTSLYIKLRGKATLIDCGEGTQIALQEQGLSLKQIDTIILTHYHADHTAGLPGLLLTMAKNNRLEPIRIYGPKGLKEVIQGVTLLARFIPFEVNCIEIDGHSVFSLEELQVQAFPLIHSVECLGYRFDLKRKPKFLVEKAKALNLPVQYWSKLQKGETVLFEGKEILPSAVLGNERKGISLVYATDTRPTSSLVRQALQADLLIAEGMYGDVEKIENAQMNKHMMMQEACDIAQKCGVKDLWLTHYSPSMPFPSIYEKMLKEIYPNVKISQDGQSCVLVFEEET
ncbi:putative ribonuclease Z [Bulleidia extructa W1219]|uniref:Ribonuclease Z n=1 Tax=Bulleidia extructa W1219 TaxID=679192 RepID=D2MNE3_9FIRM|nr:ribonuclease Z [Bulleidia extructa]EFC05965.1 putative ribonuclease Z [Bulleidia extructa W1219]